GAAGPLRRRFGRRRVILAAVLAHQPAVDQGRRGDRDAPLDHLDAQRLQHRLHHDARRTGRGHPHLRDVLVRAGDPVAALGHGDGGEHVLAASHRASDRLRSTLPASRGAGVVSERLFRWLVVGLLLAVVALPLYWILDTSFKTGRQILMSQAIYVPRPFT